jgi:hypothetical protein
MRVRRTKTTRVWPPGIDLCDCSCSCGRCLAWLGLRRARRCPRAQAEAFLWRRSHSWTSATPTRGRGHGKWRVARKAPAGSSLPCPWSRPWPAACQSSSPEPALRWITARPGEFAECRLGDLETIGRPWLFEPDPDALVELLRRVASDRDCARAKGMAAKENNRSLFTWERAVDAVERRLRLLTVGKRNGPRMNTDLNGWDSAIQATQSKRAAPLPFN